MNANPTLLQKKYARVVERYSEKYQVSLERALELFYNSELYQLVSSGISDMHCMSDEYLVEELHDEWSKKQQYNKGTPFTELCEVYPFFFVPCFTENQWKYFCDLKRFPSIADQHFFISSRS